MDFGKNAAALIKVKTIVTFVVMYVFTYLSITGKITPNKVMEVVLVIIAFFFAKKDDAEVK
jgi:hypothetical protein